MPDFATSALRFAVVSAKTKNVYLYGLSRGLPSRVGCDESEWRDHVGQQTTLALCMSGGICVDWETSHSIQDSGRS